MIAPWRVSAERDKRVVNSTKEKLCREGYGTWLSTLLPVRLPVSLSNHTIEELEIPVGIPREVAPSSIRSRSTASHGFAPALIERRSLPDRMKMRLARL